MATTTLGRQPPAPPSSDEGFGLPASGQMRTTVVASSVPRHMWAYRAGARIGKQSGQPNGTAYIGLYDGSATPDDRVAYRAGFTVSAVLADNTGGTNSEGDLVAPVLLLSGTRLWGSLDASVAYGHGQDNSGAEMYFRSGVTGTPPDPNGYTSNSPQGQLSLWVVCEDNVAPDTPVNRSPSTTQTTTTPTFGADFDDDNEALPGFAVGEADKLRQYRVQLREVGTTTLKWDATYTASTTEQDNRRWERAYAGTALAAGETYEWRTQVSDQAGAWSSWSSWLSFAVNAGGSVTNLTPLNKITDTTPDFTFDWDHGGGLSTDRVQVQLLQGGVVTKTSPEIVKTVADGATGTITASESTFGTLTRGQNFTYRIRGRDTLGLWSDYSPSFPFNVNAFPGAPTSLSPANGSATSSRPLLSFLATDVDDATSALAGQVRIKDAAGALLQTRTAPYNATTGRFEYQTLAADLATTATYRWDARATDAEGYGGYSAEYVVVYGAGPTVTVTAPTASEVLSTSAVTVAWTATDQVKYRVRVWLAADDALVYDSGEVTSATQSHVIPAGTLHEDTNYYVAVEVTNSVPLAGTSSGRNFSIDYVPPPSIAGFVASATPALFDPDGYPSSVLLTWEASSADPEAFVAYVVDRYPDGSGPDQTTVLGLVELTSPSSTAYTDHTPASGQPYRYVIRQRVMQGIDETESDPVEAFATATLAGVVLADVLAPEERRAALRYVDQRTVRHVDDRVVLRTWADKPTILEGATDYVEIDGTFRVGLAGDTDGGAVLVGLRALRGKRDDGTPVVACYRDERGRKVFVRPLEVEEDDQRRNWWTVRVRAVEVAWTEGSD